jgi:hypothetical protein
MSAPFGTHKFGMSLSRALRRARDRAKRRGVVETMRSTAQDNAYRIETLEPRILMSADIALAALPGATMGVAAEVKFLETGGRRIEVYLSGTLKSTVTDLSGGVNITGTDGDDSIIVSFEQGFDDSALALSVSGGVGVDTVTLKSKENSYTTELGSLTVTAEQITLDSGTGSASALLVTNGVTLTAASSVTGGMASILIKQSITAGGALIASAAAVHAVGGSGAAAAAQVSVSGDLVTQAGGITIEASSTGAGDTAPATFGSSALITLEGDLTAGTSGDRHDVIVTALSQVYYAKSSISDISVTGVQSAKIDLGSKSSVTGATVRLDAKVDTALSAHLLPVGLTGSVTIDLKMDALVRMRPGAAITAESAAADAVSVSASPHRRYRCRVFCRWMPSPPRSISCDRPMSCWAMILLLMPATSQARIMPMTPRSGRRWMCRGRHTCLPTESARPRG